MSTRSIVLYLFLFTVASCFLAGCCVGPDYCCPPKVVEAPEDWRWKSMEPKDYLPKDNWWELFNDPVLNVLEEKALCANPTVYQVIANVDIARAQLQAARSYLYPSLTFTGEMQRFRASANQPINDISPALTNNEFTGQVNLAFDLDLWGKLKRQVQSGCASLEASLANYYNTLLILQANLATQYFSLRVIDAEIRLLNRAVELRDQNLRLVETRYKAGLTNGLEVAQAETLKASATSAAIGAERQRQLLQNVIATLCGMPAGTLSIEETAIVAKPLEIPLILPSCLLERRPDIASAERNLAAAMANIGAAKAAFFPDVSITGYFGFLSDVTSNLLDYESSQWSVGPAVTAPIFMGGLLRANLKQAKATYNSVLANYKSVILQAFQDVEDALTNFHYLAKQQEAQNNTIIASEVALELSVIRYKKGLSAFLDVIDAERTSLDSKREALGILNSRFAASISLIQALGGGWQNADLCKPVPTTLCND